MASRYVERVTKSIDTKSLWLEAYRELPKQQVPVTRSRDAMDLACWVHGHAEASHSTDTPRRRHHAAYEKPFPVTLGSTSPRNLKIQSLQRFVNSRFEVCFHGRVVRVWQPVMERVSISWRTTSSCSEKWDEIRELAEVLFDWKGNSNKLYRCVPPQWDLTLCVAVTKEHLRWLESRELWPLSSSRVSISIIFKSLSG